MDRDRPVILHAAEAAPAPGPPTPGMDRRQLLDDDDRWVGWVQTDAGMAGGWHHHGERDSYIFVLRGTMTIEYGPGGRERVIARPGDFVFNPGGMVHREITGAEGPAASFSLSASDRVRRPSTSAAPTLVRPEHEEMAEPLQQGGCGRQRVSRISLRRRHEPAPLS